MSTSRQARIASYTLALIFVLSGSAKLLSLPFEVEAFARWGYPIAFMYFTGLLEVAGALGLLVTRLSSLASLCLATLMLGAVGTHLVHQEWPMLAIASGIALVAAWLGWYGRIEVLQLLKQFRS